MDKSSFRFINYPRWVDPDVILRAVNPVKKVKFLWTFTRIRDRWATMRDMAPHDAVKQKVIILLCTQIHDSPSPDRGEAGEDLWP